MGLTQKLGTIPLAIQTDSSNNVGIGGAANASYKLAVTGASYINGNLSVGTTNTSVRFNIQASANFETPTLGTATGTMGYLSANGLYGMYIGIGNSGNTWLQSQRNDSNTTAYSLLLNPNGGNIGIGTSNPTAPLDLWKSGGTAGLLASFTDGTYSNLQITTTTTPGTLVTTTVSSYLAFGTANAERMRINSSGYIKMSNTGDYLGAGTSYYEMLSTQNNADCFVVTHRGSSPFCLTLYYNNVTPNNTTNYFLNCQDPTNSKAFIYSNGTYGSRTGVYGSIISDEKYKTEIQPASSQWDDIKNLRVVNFKYKEDVELEGENALRQIGFIAQEVEAVSPNLVYEARDKDKEETWKSVKTSIIHLKAVKALQEAMARIEELEAKVTALENK